MSFEVKGWMWKCRLMGFSLRLRGCRRSFRGVVWG